jgi:hypothetical protein
MWTPHAQKRINVDEIVWYSANEPGKQVRKSMRDEFPVRVNVQVEGHGYMPCIIRMSLMRTLKNSHKVRTKGGNVERRMQDVKEQQRKLRG